MRIISIIISFILFVGCSRFVEVADPPDLISAEAVFASEATATQAVLGIYTSLMTSSDLFSGGSTTFYCGMAADELAAFSAGPKDEFASNQITRTNHAVLWTGFWKPAYNAIYQANVCIEKLRNSTSISDAVKRQLVGECHFLRAFCYFNLTNLFGDVPLILSSDYRLTANMGRTPYTQVYAQIIEDLQASQAELSPGYVNMVNSASDRTRPNKYAATALLAKVYAYKKQWSDCEQAATSVISHAAYNLAPTPSGVFLKTSVEAIWQLQPVVVGANTWEGYIFVPATAAATPVYTVRTGVQSAFGSGDLRKSAWLSTRTYLGQPVLYPSKYKIQASTTLSEYYMALRLADIILLRAEARAQLNQLDSAKNDLNRIRARAGLANSVATSQSDILTAIYDERRLELFAEWGNRWFDLKRLGLSTQVLQPLKGSTWSATDTLWPIPFDQILLNPNLVQNPGY